MKVSNRCRHLRVASSASPALQYGTLDAFTFLQNDTAKKAVFANKKRRGDKRRKRRRKARKKGRRANAQTIHNLKTERGPERLRRINTRELINT